MPIAPTNAAGYRLDPCDWNPTEQRLARSDDAHHGWAVWSVGGRNTWHLCEACAALPKFKRFTRRVWIGPLPPFTWTKEQVERIVPGARVVAHRFGIPLEHTVISFDHAEGRILLDGTGGSAPLAFCDPETLKNAPGSEAAC